jgi:hypothetical protein
MRKIFFVITFTSTLCCAVLANVEKASANAGSLADDAIRVAPQVLDAAPSVFGGIALFFQDNPVVIGIVGIVFVSMLVYYIKNS